MTATATDSDTDNRNYLSHFTVQYTTPTNATPTPFNKTSKVTILNKTITIISNPSFDKDYTATISYIPDTQTYSSGQYGPTNIKDSFGRDIPDFKNESLTNSTTV